ncbi:MAG: AAA family ATPase, partial [Bacteroidota bacterium]
MSFRITIPFYSFRLSFTPGLSFLNPLRDKATLRTGTSLNELSKEYQEAIQKNILNKGHATKLLDEWSTEDFIQDELSIDFPAAKDGFTYPDFELTFDIFYQELDTGFWGIIPTLGLEAFANDHASLKDHLRETVKIEFARKSYLNSVQNIISTIWFKQTELLRQDFPVNVADPGEDLLTDAVDKLFKLLNKVAKPLKIDKVQVYGRDQELEQITQVFKGNFGKNILVVGPSGVGKTALIWELSRQLQVQGQEVTIWETTASNMIKELSGDNGWEFNIGELCREFKNKPNDFLFIRNLMDLFEVGKYVGNSVSMADYLLPFISRGELNIITECTGEELARIELQSPTYKSNFQLIRLEEPLQDINQIILKKINDLAQDTDVKITKEAIKEVVRLTRRFTPYAGMPGRPIRFLESMLLNRSQAKDKKKRTIDRKTVIEHFCEDTGMPQFMVDPALILDPIKIKQGFNNNVFGQELAVESLVDILATVKADLNRSGKPIASFLFVGPTGVGKTELAKVLAEFMFGRRDRMLRFDMSEYSNPYAVMRLIGQHHTSEGQLTSAVRRAPFSVILFDEIEKADPTFSDLLLQVLSEGRLTDNRGNLANFCSAIIIMTSNIGATNRTFNPIGMGQRDEENDLSKLFESAVQKHFRPELYNRIDKVIPFK